MTFAWLESVPPVWLGDDAIMKKSSKHLPKWLDGWLVTDYMGMLHPITFTHT
jgi:hypothetical protein